MSEQQQQQQPTFQYSVKLESTAKGLVMPTVHVYGNDMEKCRKEAIEQFHKTVEELKAKNIVTSIEGGKA